jgi:hypothetical protein
MINGTGRLHEDHSVIREIAGQRSSAQFLAPNTLLLLAAAVASGHWPALARATTGGIALTPAGLPQIVGKRSWKSGV